MERTKKVTIKTTDDSPWWQKVGGGSLRIGNRIIKPGQRFQADPDEISDAFKKFVIPLSGNVGFKTTSQKEKEQPSQVKGNKSLYTVKPHGTGKLFDIVDGKGKIVNDKPLKEEAAVELAEGMNR